MKKRIYKLFLTLIVSLSLDSSPIAQNEIRKMLEVLSQTIMSRFKNLMRKKTKIYHRKGIG
ncbi:hypothetical protein [Sporofaciens sp. JLR.KK001]|uniref:hypothetical protein n=1 Tax=Sporofaciens sp. JLR.KK001 TaxID=3112621 RepID=UPI002FF0BAB0